MQAYIRNPLSIILSLTIWSAMFGGTARAAEGDQVAVVKPGFGHGKVTLGGVQFAGLAGQKDHNIATAEQLIRQAARLGAQVVMTPECAIGGYVGGERGKAVAEAIPGPTVVRFERLAKELAVHILLGLCELRGDGEVCNAMAVISSQGELRGVMRKVHLNRWDIPLGWRNGSDFPVWEFRTETGCFRGGIMICYDREMPESARVLMLQGTDIIFNPLCCQCPTVDIHRCLLRTRAFENELCLFMVNHAAPSQNGHSMAIDYHGDIVGELNEKEGILVHTFDLDALNSYREKGIYGFHYRRPELYKIVADPAGQLHPTGANLPPKGRQ